MQVKNKRETEAKIHRRTEPSTLLASLASITLMIKSGSSSNQEHFSSVHYFFFNWVTYYQIGLQDIEGCRTGLAEFILNSLEVSSHDGNIKCPCAKCLNRFWLSNNEVEVHLIVEGMDRSYLEGPWVWHGETFGDPLPSSQVAQQIAGVNTPHCELGLLLEDISWVPVEWVACLLIITPTPTRNYIRVVIHVCENDCMLYWKHNSGSDVCHTCGVFRYTTKVDDIAPSSKKRIPQNARRMTRGSVEHGEFIRLMYIGCAHLHRWDKMHCHHPWVLGCVGQYR
ncbi:hypothetical protein D8674_008370 [Pyrus ussuriensis x Pyrus communis]|uniref:Transposase-associated domain-containing protein n=1 Tax=Pyrus ussuriensis x Pyrus communis TaxID=2448454 RepID=A0A5N5HX84_9ROSA|nr:hypothetical protein D8674_008370 [Pyrus ussuriensis x Pyrus communis]